MTGGGVDKQRVVDLTWQVTCLTLQVRVLVCVVQ